MYANQTDIQKIFGGVQQYVIPLFQRPYSWENKQLNTLWQDLMELCEEEKARSHFIGSIVTMPSRSVPEGVTKYILIDGQQRLTTLLVLLAAIRDKSRAQAGNLADRIDDLLLKNRHQEGTDVYKLLPTELDRKDFCGVMDRVESSKLGHIAKAYEFFQKRLRLDANVSLEVLHNVICKGLVLVSIVLDRDDNPYLIFESLNAKGQPLTQADLIRNFFFMRIHVSAQQQTFNQLWRPMQELLEGDLTEFIRHFLMRDGRLVKQSDIEWHLAFHNINVNLGLAKEGPLGMIRVPTNTPFRQGGLPCGSLRAHAFGTKSNRYGGSSPKPRACPSATCSVRNRWHASWGPKGWPNATVSIRR